jgi:hypothetical protein
MSRRSSDEQTAVLTMATEMLDDIQNKHDVRRKEIDQQLAERRDQISANKYEGHVKDADKAAARTADLTSAQDAHAKAIARLDSRSANVEDVQRIIVRR